MSCTICHWHEDKDEGKKIKQSQSCKEFSFTHSFPVQVAVKDTILPVIDALRTSEHKLSVTEIQAAA